MAELFDGLMEEWIPDVTKTYSAGLLTDIRFSEAKLLLASLEASAKLWHQRRSESDVKALTEKASDLVWRRAIVDRCCGMAGVNYGATPQLCIAASNGPRAEWPTVDVIR